MPDHDRLFKQLLTAFFQEFIQLFFPAAHRRIDWSSLEFLDKELVSVQPKKKQVDLLAKVKTHHKGPMVLLSHLEHQAQVQSDFPERMFDYFCYLRVTYHLPILPILSIALFSFSRPLRPETGRFRLRLLRKGIINFKFHVIQLNRLDWRTFINSTNPLASALMAKMRIPVADRPIVKLQCLRLMLTLRLDPERQDLIADFVNSYLVLSPDETIALRRHLNTLDPEEAKTVQRVTNEWIKEGERRGLELGEKRGLKLGEKRGLELGEKRGLELGEKRALQQVVLKMHHQAFTPAVIASIADLEITEVLRIIEQQAGDAK